MKPLDPARLAERARGRPLQVFLDFDGTLSPHRLDGENSAPLPAARTALAELARRPTARVCIVTGRSIADVRRRVGVPGLCYAGNHGLMIEGPGASFEHPLAGVASRAIATAAGLLRARLKGRRGARIAENGLSLSLDVGLMDAEGRKAAAAVVESSTAELGWLRLRWQTGYLGWDLIPEVGWNKGDAVGYLLERDRSMVAVAVGDGLSDEAMFDRLGDDGFSVRVGFARTSAARHWVPGPRGVARLLRALARC